MFDVNDLNPLDRLFEELRSRHVSNMPKYLSNVFIVLLFYLDTLWIL